MIFSFLADLFFPPKCVCCGKPLETAGELVCSSCSEEFELTEHVLHKGNKTVQLFEDIPKVTAAASFAYYRDDSALRQVIHALKYNGRPDLGKWLGSLATREMLNMNPEWFSETDVIVPVPLHPKKQRERGYNQSVEIALGVAEVIGKPVVEDALIKTVNNQTQTQMTIEQRRHNSQHVFALNDKRADMLKGRHLLLIDDVVTTGSTLRDCIRCLTPLRNTTIQVMTIAVPAS